MNTLRQNLTTIILASLIVFFLLAYLVIRFAVVGPLRADFNEGEQAIKTLVEMQEGQTDLLEKISAYRDGLYSLNLVLEARKNIASGSDEENPYLVFDYTQVLKDLRRLLPKDARVTKFQVNNKGLITLPIESVDYASLGRVLKSFKSSELFKEVKIPSGVQRVPRQVKTQWSSYFEYVYTFVLQAQLDPEFWKNPMPFVDVDRHSYYAQAIRDLFISGVIEGYGNSYFRPNANINRAEFFKIALFEFLSNNVISMEEYREYIDLSDRDWHFKYIQLASKMGIAEGDDVGRFHPDQTITRAEALKTILSLFEITPPEANDEGEDKEVGNKKPQIMPFADVSTKDSIYPIVRLAIDNHLLDNVDRELKPSQSASRAEVAYWVWKLKFDYLN